MAQQHLGQRVRVVEQSVEGRLVEGLKRGVGRRKDGVRAGAGQLVGQAGKLRGLEHDGVVARHVQHVGDGRAALILGGGCGGHCRAIRLFVRGGRQQDTVDGVNDAVAGDDVGHDDRGVVDQDVAVAGEGERLAFQRSRLHPRGEVGRGDGALEHMILEHRGQPRRVRQERIERAGRQRIEGGVRRCKEGERASRTQRVGQAGGLQRGQQRLEAASRRGGVDKVGQLVCGGGRRFGCGRGVCVCGFLCGRGEQHAVHDVDDAVARKQVCTGDGGAVDGHGAIVGGQGQRVAGQGVHCAGRHVCGHDRSRDDVVQEHLRQLFGVRGEGSQGIGRQGGEGVVAGRKNGGGGLFAQRVHQAGVGQGLAQRAQRRLRGDDARDGQLAACHLERAHDELLPALHGQIRAVGELIFSCNTGAGVEHGVERRCSRGGVNCHGDVGADPCWQGRVADDRPWRTVGVGVDDQPARLVQGGAGDGHTAIDDRLCDREDFRRKGGEYGRGRHQYRDDQHGRDQHDADQTIAIEHTLLLPCAV